MDGPPTWKAVWPPFVVLLVTAVGAVILALPLATMTLAGFAFLGVLIGYLVYVPVFLLCDWVAVHRLPQRTWKSGRAMYKRTFIVAAVALPIAAVLTGGYAVALSWVVSTHPLSQDAFMNTSFLIFGLVALVGLVADLTVRSDTRLASDLDGERATD